MLTSTRLDHHLRVSMTTWSDGANFIRDYDQPIETDSVINIKGNNLNCGLERSRTSSDTKLGINMAGESVGLRLVHARVKLWSASRRPV